MDRREFLRGLALGTVALGSAGALSGCKLSPLFPPAYPPRLWDPLRPADPNGLRLPDGFSSRVIATSGETVPGTGYIWHGDPDGGACFAQPDGGWIYVSNAENLLGGASMVRFAADGTIVEARRILSGTIINCAGGATPWGTWLSCEEYFGGHVWECDPTGATPGVKRDAMGTFKHEAAACDPVRRVVYLTEDEGDGCFYRFTPTTWGDLASGLLEVLCETAGTLSWEQVPTPNPAMLDPATRRQVDTARHFDGGEGCVVDQDGKAFFTTKGDNRVWMYDPAANALSVVYDDSTSPTPNLTGVDNITIDRSGMLYVAEDGGNMQIVAVGAGEEAQPFVEITGVSDSEVTGPAFSPDGSRLYFSSQRNPGRTYEVRYTGA